ncbi:MAG: low molecular weight phosphotyrosine protein phosphatase, partial [Verrucomicrobiales bacterium]|nr:low molecular weight phosphotyrosine protein phosphatase [Verrucomicrobiales bacterium]
MTSSTNQNSAAKWRVLFVCGKNQWRSPTAEAVYRQDPRMEVRSAGVAGEARRKVTARDLEWALIIFTMEPKHGARLR